MTWYDDSVPGLWLHSEEVLEALGLPVREDDGILILRVANHGAVKLYQIDLILIRRRFDATYFGQIVGHCFGWFIEQGRAIIHLTKHTHVLRHLWGGQAITRFQFDIVNCPRERIEGV